MDAIAEVYEQPWTGSEALYAQASAVEVLWQDFSHKLGDQVLIPLNTYTAQFPEMKVNMWTIIYHYLSPNPTLCQKHYLYSFIFIYLLFVQKKIDKRGRKLVDYDSHRHSFQNLQANAAKRKDDVKVRFELFG